MISKDNAEHYVWGQGCDGWHLLKRPDVSVIHERMPPGTQEVRHYHRNARQLFFVLSGRATLEVGGRREQLAPHQALEVEPGVAHQVFNEGPEPLEILVISCPPSHGDRVSAP
ncbi:cupin domain-containing protein [Vitiosangium sp. GDMCC 1.1324]|uniref:cupin domain-containing protein n=1 Tax=Vitiosangium sp. (strain GDMCC 1.1324) TaxID=2138576 RepID=UPI000D35646D|nr:cupin domain-containing protein [Vitiosangium sp. GDMCC 1.1324]PTL80818.1 cupin domain-containing protein [Vitiosangium sp. GDMCC 1.1324]